MEHSAFWNTIIHCTLSFTMFKLLHFLLLSMMVAVVNFLL